MNKSEFQQLEKGTAIIVAGKDKTNKISYIIDGVLLYDSYCLSSSQPYLIQKKGVLETDNNIYICGHGAKNKQTINGYSIKEIAEMLISNFSYIGQQTIYIMACHSKHKNKDGKDMADLLTSEINHIIDGHKDIKIQSYSQNITIVVDYFKKALVADKKYMSFIFSIMQSNLQSKLGCRKLILDSSDITSQLKEYLDKYGAGIAIHNYALLGSVGKNKVEVRSILFCVTLSIAVILGITDAILANTAPTDLVYTSLIIGCRLQNIGCIIAIIDFFIAEIPQHFYWIIKDKFKKDKACRED